MESSNQTQDAAAPDPVQRAKRLRLLIIGGVVTLVAVFAFFLIRALNEESAKERWDIFEAIRTKYEPEQDPIWRNPYGVYNSERENYIEALEGFLAKKAKEDDDALEPHTRYVLAKTLADHILSNPGILDQKDRGEFYAKGVAQLEALRDDFPDFPLNWTALSSKGFPSLTRQFIAWFKNNQKWEQEHMMKAQDPAAGVRVLIRTERGDMLLGLYSADAPAWTSAFVERAVSGYYDGTFFGTKQEVGDVAEPEEHFVHAGAEATRQLKNYDTASAFEVAEVESRSGLLPEATRNRIPQDRGIVSAWHIASDEYDNAEQFIILTHRSPRLDYGYTPVGKLVQENGIDSLRTLDRIFGAPVWREDRETRDDTTLRSIMDYLQVPVKILKVIVYQDGVAKEPGEGAAETMAALDDSERKLSSIKADRYQSDPPARPSTTPVPGDAEKEDEGTAPKDSEEEKDSEKK
jgi:cyclophilin family peptidyl-prolyl cis-trans isomerase